MRVNTLDPCLLAQWSGGEWRNGVPQEVVGFGNDTRRLACDELFVAIVTDCRDGHDFLQEAQANGASGALVDSFRPEVNFPQLVVSNVLMALQSMAAQYRQRWKAVVVGITGSCGKTTCKELLTAMLGRESVLSTIGNLNNLIGVPLSMLRPEAMEVRFVVLEAGISEEGEMAQLAKMIDPDYTVVTEIGPSHLEKLLSVQAVAREKGILARGKRVKRVFAGESCERYIADFGDASVALVRENAAAEEEWSYFFRSDQGRSTFAQRALGGVEHFEYGGAGRGLASNFALAAALARSLGVEPKRIRESLESWQPRGMRGEWMRLGKKTVLLDCYNANPLSMKDSLEMFVAQSPECQPRLFLIGCMEELGESSSVYHEELGRAFPLRLQDELFVVGEEAYSVMKGLKDMGRDLERCHVIGGVEQARSRIASFEGGIFLKGSRRYRLEEALSGLSFDEIGLEGLGEC